MKLKNLYFIMIGSGVIIPLDAVEIKITNIINPYFIQMCKIPNDNNAKDILYMLQNILKVHFKSSLNNYYKPTIGDDVIISTNFVNIVKTNLPHSIYRGIVIDTTIETTKVFLLDYGISVNVPTKILIKYSRNSIPIDALASTVGIYNILPMDYKSQISIKWSKYTIDFIKELIQKSKKIYFKVLAYDSIINKKFGELFLVIEDQNVCLSKILIYSLLAIPLYDDLLQTLKNSKTENDVSIPYKLRQREIINYNMLNQSMNKSISPDKENHISLKWKRTNEKILIRTKFKCEPLKYIADSKFNVSIHEALKNCGVYTPKHIQSYMWPAIKQGFNVVTISPKASGKTIGYIVPIINYIADNEKTILKYQKNNTITKPIALILCTSINKCIDVTVKCEEILYYHNNIKCFAAFNGLLDRQLMTNICNKFHIIISTPPFLLRLLKKEKYLNKLYLSELTYLVLDHADVLLNKYLHELMDLIKNYKIINKNNYTSIQTGSMQIITVAESWTDKICSFVNIFMEDPYICIGSFIEAAVFCHVKGRMLIRCSNKKKHEILEILGDYLKVKTIIFCLKSKEAIELNDFLVSNSIKTMLVHEEMTVNKINKIKEEWKKYSFGMYPVIICTDQVLSDLEISDIDFLIHYSITITSKTQFNRRFSVFMNNWLLELNNKCKVLIIFDANKENIHFKGIINILTRLNAKLPDDWDKMSDKFNLAYNLKKRNYPFCNSIKLFGICEENSCPYRHRVIAEVDFPKTVISIGDELKLKITFIHNTTHFSARVLECIKINNKTKNKQIITIPFKILKLTVKMNEYYSDLKNRRMKKKICVGMICVLNTYENNYLRVQILNIVKRDFKTNKPKIVKVRCIDNGQIFERIYVFELYDILEEFLQFKFPIIDIFLTNILPADNEYKWSHIATNDVNDWFNKNCSRKSIIFAKVLLHIGDSIWTDSLIVHSKISGHPDLINSSLKKVIKEKEHSIENEKHMINLLHLCHKGGLTEINGCPIELPINKIKKNILNEMLLI